MRAALVALVVLTIAPHRARAEGGSLELAAGLAVPIAEDEYADANDASFKLALRGVMASSARGAFELGFDWTPANYDAPVIGDFEVDIDRFRILIGGRFGAPIGTRARAFGRIAAGVDIVSVTASGTFLGTELKTSERDVGLGLEVGGGIAVDLGPIDLGAQLALPIAFHFNENDPDDNEDFDLEYTAVDLDFLVFVAFGF